MEFQIAPKTAWLEKEIPRDFNDSNNEDGKPGSAYGDDNDVVDLDPFTDSDDYLP